MANPKPSHFVMERIRTLIFHRLKSLSPKRKKSGFAVASKLKTNPYATAHITTLAERPKNKSPSVQTKGLLFLMQQLLIQIKHQVDNGNLTTSRYALPGNQFLYRTHPAYPRFIFKSGGNFITGCNCCRIIRIYIHQQNMPDNTISLRRNNILG